MKLPKLKCNRCNHEWSPEQQEEWDKKWKK